MSTQEEVTGPSWLLELEALARSLRAEGERLGLSEPPSWPLPYGRPLLRVLPGGMQQDCRPLPNPSASGLSIVEIVLRLTPSS